MEEDNEVQQEKLKDHSIKNIALYQLKSAVKQLAERDNTISLKERAEKIHQNKIER